jgi:hypothetical protein
VKISRPVCTAIALSLCATTAQATIKLACESWKGGSEVRCEARKTDGNSKEAFTLYYGTDAPKGEWWSYCGWAGSIKKVTVFDSVYARGASLKEYLNSPNECYEVFFYNCHTEGDYIPCTQYLLTVPPYK